MTTEWNWPVELPRYTSAEYEQKKAEYVQEHGYTVHFPRFDDIVHLGVPPKPSEAEIKSYFLREYDKLGVDRWNEIDAQFRKRKERIQRMIESPAPIWYQNVASTMTFIDDLEDTLSTIAMIGRVAARFAPRLLGKIMRGPIGWLLLINDILNLSQMLTCLPFAQFSKKRFVEEMITYNPFSKKARLKRALKSRRWWPSLGDILEVAQTTDNMFGVGLSLGPMVGFVTDSAFGTYRLARGDKVVWKSEPPPIYPHELQAFRAFRALPIAFLADKEFSDDDKFMTCICANLALQVARPYYKEWNILDHLDNIDDIELEPPRPTNGLTRRALEDAGIDPDRAIGFPHFSPQDTSFKGLAQNYMGQISNNYNKFSYRNRNNMKGWIAANNVTEFTESMLAMLEDTIGIETPYQETPGAWLRAMQEKYERDTKIQELNNLREQLRASYELEMSLDEAYSLVSKEEQIKAEIEAQKRYRDQILILEQQLKFYQDRWPGFYHGRIDDWPPGGMVAGPVEWLYERDYHEIWNPPDEWRNKPKYSSYDKISWYIEHPSTPWYISYCQWGAVLSDNQGFNVIHWPRARAIAEAKIPYSFNPQTNVRGLGTIQYPYKVDVWIYCRLECNFGLLPDWLKEYMTEINTLRY